jgi:Flp pilus assembly protein TadG
VQYTAKLKPLFLLRRTKTIAAGGKAERATLTGDIPLRLPLHATPSVRSQYCDFRVTPLQSSHSGARMRIGKTFFKCESGQALIETALVLPIMLTVIFNAVNFGYFFIVALNVVETPRTGAMYSVMGYQTPGSPTIGAPGNVPDATPPATSTSAAYLLYEDMRGALKNYASATIQICSTKLGYASGTFGTTTQAPNCQTCTSNSSTDCSGGTNAYTPTVDPEAPTFTLHRVDVQYTFTTLISGSVFNVVLPSTLCPSGTCTFHRNISMRAMN